MLKFANIVLVLSTLGTAALLYNLEHDTRGLERQIARTKAEIVDTSEAIKLLNAEWSSLTRLERIQQLAETQLGMKRIEPDQYVTAEELPAKLQELAKVSAPEGKATIDDILKKMQ
jgi:cell division protein FtsL